MSEERRERKVELGKWWAPPLLAMLGLVVVGLALTAIARHLAPPVVRQYGCRIAPRVALELDRLRPAGTDDELWACGVRLGDAQTDPAYLCYRMTTCVGSER